jgi:hypothetical protein
VGILFKEKLGDNKIGFEPSMEQKFSESKIIFGHETKDASIHEDRLWLAAKGILTLFN